MAKHLGTLGTHHQTFVEGQHTFFCATAANIGRVNISPKDMTSMRGLTA